VTKPPDTKAARKKSAAAAANHKGAFEETAFGRRRISRIPKTIVALGGLLAIPFVLLYRRLRRSRSGE